jgi:hypothetical protein
LCGPITLKSANDGRFSPKHGFGYKFPRYGYILQRGRGDICVSQKNITMSNKKQLPQVISDFIAAVNAHDGEAFIHLFADDALVNDVARNFWGKEAIKNWSDEEMIKAKVTFSTDEVMEHYGDFMVTALTDGEYDKANLPNPLYLDYFFSIKNDRIITMYVSLNKKKSGTNTK